MNSTPYNKDYYFNTEIISLNTDNENFGKEKFNYFSKIKSNSESPQLQPCNISEQFYQLHLLKQQQQQSNKKNDEILAAQQNYKEGLYKSQANQNNGLQYLNSREQYDVDNYEPPQYESWEEEEDLDVIIDLNRSNSFNSGIFQFESNNKDYILNSQLESWKL
ncbi:hypothetical protein QEN19_002745 [Hanseniaspora menglaensis]